VSAANGGRTPSVRKRNAPAVTIGSSLGPITLYSPYLDYANPNVPPVVPDPYSLNWGVFWAELSSSEGDD